MILKRIENRLETLSIACTPFTNVLGLSRSILALGTLLTLLFNPINNLYYQYTDGSAVNQAIIDSVKDVNFFLIFGEQYIGVQKVLAILILLWVISGYWMKISSILHWWVTISFIYFSCVLDGGDQIAGILAFLFIPICIVDPRFNHWQRKSQHVNMRPWNYVGIFGIILVRIQMAIIYFHASVGKMDVLEWQDGTALYYWLNHSIFGMPDSLQSVTNSLMQNEIFVTLCTFGVLIFELVLFGALFMPVKYRIVILPLALIFHAVIIIYLGIFSFFFSMASGLLIYLLNCRLSLKDNYLVIANKISTHLTK